MNDETPNPDTIEKLLSRARKRPPWQVMMTGHWNETGFVSKETKQALEKILELRPDLRTITLRGSQEYAVVRRDFPSDYLTRVDDLIARIFRDDPHLTAIEFPGHTATPDDPYWSSTGKASAAISAAHQAGEITAEEAVQKLNDLHRQETNKGASGAPTEGNDVEE